MFVYKVVDEIIDRALNSRFQITDFFKITIYLAELDNLFDFQNNYVM